MASEWDVDWRENSGFEYLQTRKISNCTKEWIGCYVVIVHAEQTGYCLTEFQIDAMPIE